MSDEDPTARAGHDFLESEDEVDIEIRSPRAVRERVLVLAAVLRRLALEDAPADGTELLTEAFDERAWLREEGLADAATPRELTLLDSLPGSLASDAIAEASWEGEALLPLAWAVGGASRPPIDHHTDPRPVLDWVPRPWTSIERWVSDPATISEEEALQERERAEIWHWRVTTELLRRQAPPADRDDHDAAIRAVASEALAAGIVPALCDDDFPTRGRSVSDLEAGDLDELIAITGQRLRAMNWLCGFGMSWDEVPLDV